jgi:hypothetical protein
VTSVTLRPNATATAPDSVTGAATAHAATNDDSDASYYTETSGPPLLDLGTFTLSTGVTKHLRIRARWAVVSVPSALWAELTSSGAQVVPLLVEGVVTSTIMTSTSAYTPVTLTQSTIDALRLSTFNPTSDAYRVYELYVDVVYVTIPVVSLNAITDPYTTGSLIPISWVNTLDADGGGQTHYQAWVTADSGGATVYDSGVVASSATTANVGPLANGADYTVHLKVAQTVNGVKHWSAEDTQAAVTLNVTTVDVSAVDAVADNATGKIAVTVTRDVADGAWDFVEVERSIDAGATWTPVRGATYVDPPLSGTHVVDDYEVPNGTSVIYRARAIWLSSGLPIYSAWTESSSTSWTSTDTWFKVPGTPSLNVALPFRVLPTKRHAQRRGVFTPLGASTPVVVSDVRTAMAARLQVPTDDEGEAADLLAVLSRPVVLIQTPTTIRRWGSRYVSPGDVSEDPLDPDTAGNSGYAVWSFDVDEVASPGDPDAGSP